MADFSSEDYFSRRLNKAKQATADFKSSLEPNRAKIESVMQASAEKSAALSNINAAMKLDEESWVNKLGLSDHSALGQITNLGANIYSGASRAAGDATAFVAADVPAMFNSGQLQDHEIEAINRYKQGTATPEDLGLIKSKQVRFQDGATPEQQMEAAWRAEQDRNAKTPLELFEKATAARQRSSMINDSFDRNAVVRADRKDKLVYDLGEEFQAAWDQTGLGNLFEKDKEVGGIKDMTVGLAKLLYNAGEAAVTNPGGSAEYVVENLPQLLVGSIRKGGTELLGLTNAGYASENYQKGIEKYQAEHNGAIPPEAERRKMAMYAASTAVAEHVVDTKMLDTIRGAGKGVAEAEKEMLRAGFKDSLKNIGRATAGGTVAESITEGYQTFAEGQASLTDVSAQDIYTGAAIGGIAGGGMTGGGTAVVEALSENPNKAIEREKEASAKETFTAAVESNDPSAYLDQTADTYSPSKAVAVLHANSQLPTATPETQTENVAKATEIISTLDDEIQSGWAELFTLEDTNPEDKTGIKTKTLELDKLERELSEARKVKDSLLSLQTSVADIKGMVEAANEEVDTTNPAAVTTASAAAESVINLSMQMPGSVSQEEALQLADNTSNSLSDTQRTYLRSFSESQVASNLLKTMGKVSQDILHGSPANAARKFIGISEYQSKIGEAIITSNLKRAQAALKGLTKFANDHANKLNALTTAFEEFKRTGTAVQVISDGKQGWSINAAAPLSEKELRNAGGLSISANSAKLIANTELEVDALNKATAAMGQAVSLKFNTQPVTASATPAAQATASPTPAASVASAQPDTKSDTASAVEAAAETAKAVEGETQKENVTPEEKRVDSAPPQEVTSPAPLIDRTDENSGSTVRLDEASREVAAEATPETPTTTGLDALSEKSPESAEYQQRNLLADFFLQSQGPEGAASTRPLVTTKNFLSQWTEPESGWNDKQKALLDLFKKATLKWDKVIKSNLTKHEGQEAYWFKDLMQFFVQGSGKDLDLEENVKTAMSFSGFSWVAETAARGTYNTPEEINIILGRDEDHRVSDMEYSRLAAVGTRQNVVVNALGQRVVQALGLKAKKNAPLDLMPRLESAMGAHVMKLLLDQGVLVRNSISGSEMADLTGQIAPPNASKVSHYFLVLNRDADGNLHPQADAIVQASKGTQGILEKLFSVEAGLKLPSLEPIPFVQKKTKNTNQSIPEILVKTMEEENAVANYVRDDSLQLVQQLSKETLLAIAGAEQVTERTHVTKRRSIQAKNDALERELDRFMEFYDTMDDKAAPLYLDHSVWMQQRVGIATNAINPQSSKIHRHLLYRKAWESEVDINNPEQMDNFRLRVAEGLGIKTDKQDNKESLEVYQAKLLDPAIKSAVAVLRKAIYEGGITTEEQQTLLEGVKAGKENMHSLDALISLAHYAEALAKQKTSFTVQMMGEVDGVTNGPMLSHLLLGAASSISGMFELLNRGGFYQEGSAENQYNIWRGVAGRLDLYERTALHINQTIQDMVAKDQSLGRTLNAVYAFTGELANSNHEVTKDGRNVVKTPLTAMVFGSSLKSSVDSMADKFIESIYDKIENIDSEEKRTNLISNLNVLGAGIAPNTTVEQLLELEFKGRQLNDLTNAFKASLGKAVEATMKFDFDSFIQQRKKFNIAAQMTFELYNAAFTGMRESYIQELIEAKEIAVNSKGKPLHELTAEQEAVLHKRLSKLEPVMHSAMSKTSGSLKAGLRIGKSARKLSQKATYSGEIKFGNTFSDNGTRSTETHAYETVASNPGVAMLPVSVHAFDSSISHEAARGNEVLNVHDAHGAGLATFEQTARNLNQAVWNNMMNYSPASEMFSAMSRTMQGLAELVQAGNLPTAVTDNLNAVAASFAERLDVPPAEVLTSVLFDTQEMAFMADDMKYRALSQMASIDQYALEGGNYQVTAENRTEAESKRAALNRDMPQELRDAVNVLNQAMTKGEVTQAPESKPDQELDATPTKAKAPVTPVAPLGASRIASDPELVALFEKQPVMPVKTAIQALLRKLKAGKATNIKAFHLQLLARLYKVLPAHLTINYVTPDTPMENVLLTGADRSRGWYVSTQEGQQAIYVLSPDFAYSGLTTEILMHEMLHGALARMIESELQAKDPDSDAYALIKELEVLRTKAQDLAGTDPRFAPALENIHEFVSWGMTNQEFQREILNKITMRSTTKKNALVAGMQAFIKLITGILFKGTTKSHQAVAVNGMTVLISNVSGLLNQAEQNSAPRDIVLDQQNNAATEYTAQSLYEGLNTGAVNPAFSEHLQGLLGNIVEKLHGPFGSFKESFMGNAAGTPTEVLTKAIVTGIAPFASKVQASGLKISSQELFVLEQVEATVKIALDDNIAPSRVAYRELVKLYKEARETLKPSDFDDPADYEFIFKLEVVNGKTDHLARFAALGLTHQKFNQLLKIPTKLKTAKLSDAKTLGEWLQHIFEAILETFSSRIAHIYEGQQADEKLETLVGQLVDIEAKRRVLVERNKDKTNYGSLVDEKLSEGVSAAVGKLEEFGRSSFFKNSKNGFIKAAGSVSSTFLGGRQKYFMAALSDMHDRSFSGRPGLISGLLNELKDPTVLLHDLLRAERHRNKHMVHVKTQTSIFALEGFANKGEDLSLDEKKAVSAVMLRTGAHHLLDHYSMTDLENMLSDKVSLGKAITDEVLKLGAFPKYIHYFIHQAKVLGYHRATEETKGKMRMESAGNIARLYGTPYANRISEAQATEAEATLNVLVALYGLSYSSNTDKSRLARLLKAENQRTDGNGIESVLRLHKDLENQSRERLFAGNEALMAHGYVPETYNPHTDIRIAEDATEGRSLLDQGYVLEGPVTPDPLDPDKTPKSIYVMRDGGAQPLLTAIIAYHDLAAKGTSTHTNKATINMMTAAKQPDIMQMFRPNASFDPSKVHGNYASPVLNNKGEIANWRYMMNKRTRDNTLERDNRFENILGQLAGSIFDKETVTESNARAIKAAHEIYKNEFAQNTEAFIKVSPTSLDPEMREIYRLMPEATKKVIEEVWGRDGMLIRKDSLDMFFGYHKLSLSGMFDKPRDERNALENAFTFMVEFGLETYVMALNSRRSSQGLAPLDPKKYVRRAALKVRQAERFWQEMVKELKDIIIVKTGTVMVANITSNFVLLKMYGVPAGDMVKNSLIAARGAREYQKDSAALFQLEQQISSGFVTGDVKEVEREITRLKDALARNPVRELIDAGLMPTIAEDLDATADDYSYKSAFVKKTEKFTSKLNPKIVDIGKTIYMAKGTKLYQALSEVTQLSDFVARYALYQHLTTRQKNPMSVADATQRASDAFVNYDIPMHRMMAYSDDMGLTMFSKYFIRIQRVLANLAQEHPGNVLATMLMTNYIWDIPNVLDSSPLSRIGNNPFSPGALAYPGALDELATVNAGLSVFR